MTVYELIKKLETMPREAVVYFPGLHDDYEVIDVVPTDDDNWVKLLGR